MLSVSKNNQYRIAVEKWTIDIASLWKLTIAEVYSSSAHAFHRMRDATSSPRGDFPQYLAWHVGKKNFPATPTSFHAFVSFGNSDLWVPAEHLCSALSHHTPQSFCTYTSTPLLLYDLLTSDDEEYFCKTILINDLRIFYASRAFGIVAYRIGSIPNLKANSGLRIPQHLWSMDCMDEPVGLGRTRPSTAPMPLSMPPVAQSRIQETSPIVAATISTWGSNLWSHCERQHSRGLSSHL